MERVTNDVAKVQLELEMLKDEIFAIVSPAAVDLSKRGAVRSALQRMRAGIHRAQIAVEGAPLSPQERLRYSQEHILYLRELVADATAAAERRFGKL
ncbi:hypothetical protein AAP_02379 [Ascosphaera apis ARSEF 7405]|uniref:Uncharacterized protein n=1 Tax=Ascosphaera apis ARSEF 7405 TaxID=392613 RepID=A0A168A804_9EURO|nr:hypothetical protein AAP_02379 [Ascosphaera apis ARSEF 7405]